MFSLARQAYLTEAIPFRWRARALSTLGGTLRIGLFIGPFVAAVIVSRWNIGAAYGFAAVMSLAARAQVRTMRAVGEMYRHVRTTPTSTATSDRAVHTEEARGMHH